MAVAAALESHGIVRLHRWPVPMRVEPKPHQCQCGAWATADQVVWTGPTGSDFFGVTSSGRAVLVEAKSLQRPRLPLGITKGSGVNRHQLLELIDWHRAGALALIVWECGDNVAVFDPDVFMPQGSRTPPKSLAWEDIPANLKKPTVETLELFAPYLSIRRPTAASVRS